MPRRHQAEVAVVRPAQPRPDPRAAASATERRLAGAMEVPIDQVAPDPGQPRQDWGHGDGERRLDELAASIREFGILQPLLVREGGATEDGRQRYIIIAGGRRRAAAERAGIATLPIVVRGEEVARVRLLQLVENVQRQDLSMPDEARAYKELMDLEGLTPPALAARLHVSAQHVRDRLRVLSDPVLADAVERGQISATAAREITKLPDEEAALLRGRVAAGEAVETADVAESRARLAASGAVNPRRKSGHRAHTPPVAPGSIPDDADDEGALPGSTTGDTQAPRAGEGDQGRGTNGRAASKRGRRAADDPRMIAARIARTLDASLEGDHRADIARALDGTFEGGDAALWWPLVYERLRDLLHNTGTESEGSL